MKMNNNWSKGTKVGHILYVGDQGTMFGSWTTSII